MQTTSHTQGELYEFHGIGGEGDDCEKLAKSLNEKMRWIWEYDVDGQLSSALGELEGRSGI